MKTGGRVQSGANNVVSTQFGTRLPWMDLFLLFFNVYVIRTVIISLPRRLIILGFFCEILD